MNVEQIRALLGELADELAAQGINAHLFVVGGAAMALANTRDRTTDDVDAAFVPAADVRAAAARVGARHGLDDGWLNDAVKGYLHPNWPDSPDVVQVLETSSLTVSIASTRQMLAMKVAAARVDRDEDDIRALAASLDLTTADQVLAIAEQEYGAMAAKVLGPKSQFAVQAMFD